MIQENDKLNIPEEYLKMSPDKLKAEREKLYQGLKKEPQKAIQKTFVLEPRTVTFRFCGISSDIHQKKS